MNDAPVKVSELGHDKIKEIERKLEDNGVAYIDRTKKHIVEMALLGYYK